MMGGLAYMTGRPGDPVRAGTSVNDIMGGLFGAIGALGALIQRGITGRGMEVQSALFENNVFLMGQHMLQYAVTGRHPAPMPARESPWAIYDVFTVADGEQIFLAAVSDAQWQTFCDALGFADLKANRIATQQPAGDCASYAAARRSAGASRSERATTSRTASRRRACRSRRSASPRTCSTIRTSLATGGLADVRLPDGPKAGETVKTTLFPITMDGSACRCAWTRRRWASTRASCSRRSATGDEIDTLIAQRAVA